MVDNHVLEHLVSHFNLPAMYVYLMSIRNFQFAGSEVCEVMTPSLLIEFAFFSSFLQHSNVLNNCTKCIQKKLFRQILVCEDLLTFP